MIYFNIQLDGQVRIYELSDRLAILIAALETRAQSLPIVETLSEAISYFRSKCYQFECFAELEDAQYWIDDYLGFREAEIRKQWRGFMERRSEFALDFITAA